jgi:hypothetical protein
MKKLFILLLLFCFWQCNKKNEVNKDDLSGKDYIRGRLFLYDQLTQQANGTPLAEKKVSVGYESSPDSLNFLFSATTDKDGYFIFPNLKKNTAYRVYYEETMGGVLYRARDTAIAPIDSLRLTAFVALTGQNGLHLTVLDPSGSAVNGVSSCVFNSPAITGYTNNACDGNTFKLTSDAFGHASRFSIAPGTYYINSSIDINGMPWISKDTIVVSTHITFDTIRLKIPNGMRFTVMDSLGTRVADASVCVFTSLALYQRDTCQGSNFQLTSSVNGEASRYNLPQQRYYIYSTFITGSFIWATRDTIDMTTQIIHDTLVLRKK